MEASIKRGEEGTDKSLYPLATGIIDGAVVYDRSNFPSLGEDPEIGRALEREIMHAFSAGSVSFSASVF